MRPSLRARDGLVVGRCWRSAASAITAARARSRSCRGCQPPGFRCFWSTATGWGTFAFGQTGTPLRLQVLSGTLACRVLVMPGGARVPPVSVVRLAERVLPHTTEPDGATRRVSLSDAVVIGEGQELVAL